MGKINPTIKGVELHPEVKPAEVSKAVGSLVPEILKELVPQIIDGAQEFISKNQIPNNKSTSVLSPQINKRQVVANQVQTELMKLIGSHLPAQYLDKNGLLSKEMLKDVSYADFKENLLKAYAGLNDGKFFRAPYASLLDQDKYEPLIIMLYSGRLEGLDLIASPLSKESMEEVSLNYIKGLKSDFVREWIDIDPKRAVQESLSSGPEGMKFIENTFKEQAAKYKSLREKGVIKNGSELKNNLVSFSNAIIDVIEEKGWAHEDYISEARAPDSAFAYDDNGLKESNFRKLLGQTCELMITAQNKSQKNEARSASFIKEPHSVFMSGPEGDVKFDVDTIKAHLKNLEEAEKQNGSVAALKVKLNKVILFSLDPNNWYKTDYNPGDIDPVRLELYQRSVMVLRNIDSIKSDAALKEYNENLKGLIESEDAAFEDIIDKLPKSVTGPLSDLKNTYDEWLKAADMNVNIYQAPVQSRYEDKEIAEKLDRVIYELNQIPPKVAQGYKQHAAVSRGASQIALLFDAGDIQDLMEAQKAVDDLTRKIAKAQNATQLDDVIKDLYAATKKDGVLFNALQAAEMDGIEASLKSVQIAAEAIAVALVTKGVGAARVLAQAAELAGSATEVARTAVVTTEVAELAGATADAMNYGARLLSVAKEGAKVNVELIAADNLVEKATGGASAPQSKKQFITSLAATGVAGAMFKSLSFVIVGPAEGGVIQYFQQRYLNGVVNAAKHYALDTVAFEIPEEVTENALQQWFETGKLEITDFLNTALATLAGGPIQQGVTKSLAHAAAGVSHQVNNDLSNDTDISDLTSETVLEEESEVNTAAMQGAASEQTIDVNIEVTEPSDASDILTPEVNARMDAIAARARADRELLSSIKEPIRINLGSQTTLYVDENQAVTLHTKEGVFDLVTKGTGRNNQVTYHFTKRGQDAKFIIISETGPTGQKIHEMEKAGLIKIPGDSIAVPDQSQADNVEPESIRTLGNSGPDPAATLADGNNLLDGVLKLIGWRRPLIIEDEGPSPVGPERNAINVNMATVGEISTNLVEIFHRIDKAKYVGYLSQFYDDAGEVQYLFEDEKTGQRVVYDPADIVSIHERGNAKEVERLNNIFTGRLSQGEAQFTQGSYNQSGREGTNTKMMVRVDFADPRLADFITQKFGPVREALAQGKINSQQAAIKIYEIIRDQVPYDEKRIDTGIPNHLYSLGDFVETGICNERGMLVQIGLQYLGIQSKLEKGAFMGGRHAWVRVSDPGQQVPEMILDPQGPKVIYTTSPGYQFYVSDGIRFKKDSLQTSYIPAIERNAAPEVVDDTKPAEADSDSNAQLTAAQFFDKLVTMDQYRELMMSENGHEIQNQFTKKFKNEFKAYVSAIRASNDVELNNKLDKLLPEMMYRGDIRRLFPWLEINGVNTTSLSSMNQQSTSLGRLDVVNVNGQHFVQNNDANQSLILIRSGNTYEILPHTSTQLYEGDIIEADDISMAYHGPSTSEQLYQEDHKILNSRERQAYFADTGLARMAGNKDFNPLQQYENMLAALQERNVKQVEPPISNTIKKLREYILREERAGRLPDALNYIDFYLDQSGYEFDELGYLRKKPVEQAGETPVANEVPVPLPVPPLQRHWPQGSMVDTIMGINFETGKVQYANDGNGINFIQDDEISAVILEPSGFDQLLEGQIPYGIDPYGKHVVQQAGMRGCTAAAAAMLILDNGGIVNVTNIKRTNLGTTKSMADEIDRSGLTPVIVGGMSLEQATQQYGSLIITLGGEIGGHVVVLDYISVSENKARIRDPFHGWSIETTATAILARGASQPIAVIRPSVEGQPVATPAEAPIANEVPVLAAKVEVDVNDEATQKIGLTPNTDTSPRRGAVNLPANEIHGDLSLGTHEGIGYKNRNEDAFVYGYYTDANGKQQLYAVILDGMGGHKDGDKAAELGGKTIDEQMKEGSGLFEAFKVASEAITNQYGKGKTAPGAVAAGFQIIEHDGKRFARIVHVGDASIKVLRKNEQGEWFVVHATKDEGAAQILRSQGGIHHTIEMRIHPLANVVSNALGGGSKGKGQMDEIELQPGDRIVGMSDGLGDNTETEELLEVSANNDTASSMREFLLQMGLDKMASYAEAKSKFNEMYNVIMKIQGGLVKGQLAPATGLEKFGYTGYFVNSEGQLLAPDQATVVDPLVALSNAPGFWLNSRGHVLDEDLKPVDRYKPDNISVFVYEEK